MGKGKGTREWQWMFEYEDPTRGCGWRVVRWRCMILAEVLVSDLCERAREGESAKKRPDGLPSGATTWLPSGGASWRVLEASIFRGLAGLRRPNAKGPMPITDVALPAEAQNAWPSLRAASRLSSCPVEADSRRVCPSPVPGTTQCHTDTLLPGLPSLL